MFGDISLKILSIFSILLSMAMFLVNCGQQEPAGTRLDGANVQPEIVGYFFVGCRPSAGECKNSCPERNGIFTKKAPKLCEQIKDPDSYLCYCKYK